MEDKKSILNNKIIKIIGALTAFVAALVTIIFTTQALIGQTPELEVRLLEKDLLTKTTNLKGLRSIYIYKSDTIPSLWRCRIQISNTGNKNIIGKGIHTDLIENSLEINFDSHFSLIKIEPVIQKESLISLDFNRNAINFKFDQWLVNEKVELVAYFINNNLSNEFHIPINQKRSIENGKIIVLDYKNIDNYNQPSIDKFKYPIPIIARILSCIFCMAILIVLFSLYKAFPSYKEAKAYWEWNKVYGKEYKKYLIQHPSDYGFEPEKFGKEKIPKPPHINSSYRTPLSALYMLTLYILAILSTFACILCVIKI